MKCIFFTVIIELLLDWDKNLTTQVDNDGSTPLHFAVSPFFSTTSPSCLRLEFLCRFFRVQPTYALTQVFNANSGALYQADKNGLFPIHVAASIGARDVIRFFLQKHPDNAGLRDAKGRTFLHVAIEEGSLNIVSDVCGEPSLAWILNMKDHDGNTALHLAIKDGSFRMFCALLANLKVNLDQSNNQGETPYDVALIKHPCGRLLFTGNPESRIEDGLSRVGASNSAIRLDKNGEKYHDRPKPEDDDKQSEMLKDSTQKFIVASVLIANMAFSATFAIPGGYRADDHTNGGTPTLAGGYIFDAFIMATALTFICSLIATTGFMMAGLPTLSLEARGYYLCRSEKFFRNSVTCMSIAFALGVYMVLDPIARNTAVTICVITPTVLVVRDIRPLLEGRRLLGLLLIRKRRFRGMVIILLWIMYRIIDLWPLAVIFLWAAFARIQWRHLLLRVIQWLDIFGLHTNGL